MSEILAFPNVGDISDNHLGNAVLFTVLDDISCHFMKIVVDRIGLLSIKPAMQMPGRFPTRAVWSGLMRMFIMKLP